VSAGWKANGRPRLFVECPAGLAAVSLRLHGGDGYKPPFSRIGNKVGYAEAILRVLGLTDGQGADRYLWAEADPDVAALLHAYSDADMLRRAAEIIRTWAGEDPRALWERCQLAWALGVCQPDALLACWIYTVANSFVAGTTSGVFSNKAGSTDPADYQRTSPENLAVALERLAESPCVNAETARVIPDAASLACWIGTPGDLTGVVVYMDPPYLGTMAYNYELSRSEVVRLAKGYARLGATVAISEATPISMGRGWHAVRITELRVGSRRTFSKQKEEWLTISHSPACLP
jgi:hypothetical protein